MRINIHISNTDILTIKNLAPMVAKAAVNKFFGKKDCDKSFNKNGVQSSWNWSILSGFSFNFEGSASDILSVLEKKTRLKFGVIIEAYSASVIMMMGAMQASADAYKEEHSSEGEE